MNWSHVTKSNRRPSPYHAHLFCRMVSRWVELPQFQAMGVSGCAVLCLSSAGSVTWFATEPSDVGGVWPGLLLRETAIEIPQAALESRYEVWGDRWLPFGVTARWLGARLFRLVDAQRCIQQPVGVR
jgi:hypothetical protein